jgi:N-methylhydantoinase A
VRYAGQAYEITVPFARDWRARFHALHGERFGHADPTRPLELVTLRVRVRGGGATAPAEALPRRGRPASVARRAVSFDGRRIPTVVHRRETLPVGWSCRGPAIVCEYSATTVVPPGWRACVDRTGGLVLERTR